MDEYAKLAIASTLEEFGGKDDDKEMRLANWLEACADISDKAIMEASSNFRKGLVKRVGFKLTSAEFAQEARRIEQLMPYRSKKSFLPPPEQHNEFTREHRRKMQWYMKVGAEGLSRGRAGRAIDASRKGLPAMISLAEEWNVDVPEWIRNQVKESA